MQQALSALFRVRFPGYAWLSSYPVVMSLTVRRELLSLSLCYRHRGKAGRIFR